jgi:NADH-quinone oxidoreductase subunit N
LLGFSYIYGFTGLTNLEDLSVFIFQLNDDTSVFLSLAIIFVLTGIFFKLAAAPFHLWSPDIYEGSPTVSTVFFAVLPKLSLTVLLVRVVYFSFSSIVDSWRYLIVIIGVLSILVGSFVGLEQRKFKSLLAYSSIGHMGYLLI